MVISPTWVDTMTMERPEDSVTDSSSVKQDEVMDQEHQPVDNPIGARTAFSSTFRRPDGLDEVKREIEILHKTMVREQYLSYSDTDTRV